MEDPLLPKEEESDGVGRWELGEEVKKVNHIAIPMIVATVSQYLLRLAPMLMLGHLSELSLSSAAIATSISHVTGFSIVFGLSTALDTLCGQAYGARQYQRLANITYGATICLLLVCLPVSLLWIFMDKALILIGQDPMISHEAGKYLILLIPSLFPYAVLQSLVRYLQTQSLILPILLSSVAAICVHIPLCWTLIFKLELGNTGAALAVSLSYWFNVILLLIYVKLSPACERTRLSLSGDAFLTIGEFFRIAIPSATMVCFEWWSFELVLLLSGLLPNPELETSVLSICFTISSIHYHIPYSFGAAASTRISNELGAGNPRAAKLTVWIVLALAVAEAISASTILFCCRYFLGHAFSDEMEVVVYMKKLAPLICLSITLDSLQIVFSGVARGSGLQSIGAYINLGAFYLAGIPMSIVLGFFVHLKGMGLWGGLTIGTAVQSTTFFLVTVSINWQKQVEEARKRIFKERISAENPTVLE